MDTDRYIGINMLVYFSTRIFANIGLTSFMSQLLAAVMNTCFAIGTYCKSYPSAPEHLTNFNIIFSYTGNN